MGKLTITDTLQDIVLKLAANNPGAMRVLFELMRFHEDGKLMILKFDDFEIYGSLIWLCWKDLLNYDTAKLFELLRTDKLKEAISTKMGEDEAFRKEWEYSQRHEEVRR